MSRMTRRQKVQKRLRTIQHRLQDLFAAEHNRDRITRRRKKKYRKCRDLHGDDHPLTKQALRAYRRSRALSLKIDKTEAVLRTRASMKIEWLRKHPAPLDPDGDGLILVDGVQVSEGVGREILRIRSFGVWDGVLVSGFRTPAHSTEICIDMCGAPKCPGKCAGVDSRHAKKGGRDGAGDVTDPITFAHECARHDSWLENHLPQDLVHFSDIGN